MSQRISTHPGGEQARYWHPAKKETVQHYFRDAEYGNREAVSQAAKAWLAQMDAAYGRNPKGSGHYVDTRRTRSGTTGVSPGGARSPRL